MKGVVDYLKENGKYKHDAMGRNFTLELEGKVVTLRFHGHEWLIAVKLDESVDNEIMFLLEDNFGIEIRFCETCGKPFDAGFTADDGGWYCCENCFEDTMNKDYGKGKWRGTSKEGKWGGYYEHLKNDGTWEDTGIYYTEWY